MGGLIVDVAGLDSEHTSVTGWTQSDRLRFEEIRELPRL